MSIIEKNITVQQYLGTAASTTAAKQAAEAAQAAAEIAQTASETAQGLSEAARDIAVSNRNAIQPVIDDLANILSVQADLPEINAVHAKLTEINAVYAALANINIVAGDTVAINALYTSLTELLALHTQLAKLIELHTELPELLALHLQLAKLTTLYDNLTALVAIYDNLAAILNLNSNLAHVTTVEAALVAITTVSNAIDNVNTVAGGIANVNTVAGGIANVNVVADNKVNIDAVADNIESIQGAVENAAATAADRVQTGADRVAVAADKDYVENLVITAGTSPLWYGVEWDTEVSSPDGLRIGNSDLHRELPIQNGMYGCVLADNGVEAYRLNPANWAEKLNGGASVLDGTDGQVMVYIPGFYFKYELVGTTWRMKLSQFELPGFTYSPPQYVSAYEAAVRRADNVLSSVKNTTAAYRGGNNNDAWDAEDRTLLGMPATSISRTNFRTYARARGTGWEMYNYFAHWKMTWLFVVEYATLNSQKAYNAALDINGYKQGGLGAGVTNINSTHWNAWNSYYPFIPNGHTDSLANGTGEVSFIMPAGYNSNSGLETFANRYRGIELPFGHIWKNADGVNIRAAHAADADPTHRIYVSETPAHWNDTVYTNMTDIGIAPRADGYIKQMLYGHIVPLIATGGGSTTFWCDRWYQDIPASSPALRTLLLGGAASTGASAGLGCSFSSYSPADTLATIGSRLCFIPA